MADIWLLIIVWFHGILVGAWITYSFIRPRVLEALERLKAEVSQ